MSVVLATLMAATTATIPSCSWDRPGANPFGGDLVAAVDRYSDIPPATRAALKARMARRAYDDLAVIRRDTIEGRHRYADLRDMHFAQGRVCRSVTRDRWAPQTEERGLVYCEDAHCLIVPTVCRNLSRITRLPDAPPPEPKVALAETEVDVPFPAPPAPEGELDLDPPSAGPGKSFSEGMDDSVIDAAVVPLDHPDPDEPPWLPGDPIGGPVFGPVFGPGGGGGGGGGGPGSPTPPSGPFAPPVPEPATWALMLGGLGVVAWAGTRRRRHVVFSRA